MRQGRLLYHSLLLYMRRRLCNSLLLLLLALYLPQLDAAVVPAGSEQHRRWKGMEAHTVDIALMRSLVLQRDVEAREGGRDGTAAIRRLRRMGLLVRLCAVGLLLVEADRIVRSTRGQQPDTPQQHNATQHSTAQYSTSEWVRERRLRA